MFDLNGTLVIFIVSFLIFMWLLNETFLKPVGKTLELRAKKIQGDIDSGKEARESAQALLETYEGDLKRIRTESQAVINSAVEEANKQRAAEIDKVAKHGQKKLDEAREALAVQRGVLIDALVAPISELVEVSTKKVLGDESVHVSIDKSQVKRTLEEKESNN
jgi:F-type H+-transporting ATPase subunit b